MTKSRTLLVIADLFFAAKLKECARSFGFDTVGAANLDVAKKRLVEARPDAVFLSMNKQGFDWEAFLTHVRADNRTTNLPVLVFGSHVDRDGFRRADELGANLVVPNSRVASEFPYLLASLVRL
jgi:hypothetical protein